MDTTHQQELLWQQACRRTLKIVSGVNTNSAMALVGITPPGGRGLEPSDLLRLALRDYKDDYERLLVAICIASRGRRLKSKRSGHFTFNGKKIRLPRSYFVAKEEATSFLETLKSLFTKEEIEEMDTPVKHKKD